MAGIFTAFQERYRSEQAKMQGKFSSVSRDGSLMAKSVTIDIPRDFGSGYVWATLTNIKGTMLEFLVRTVDSEEPLAKTFKPEDVNVKSCLLNIISEIENYRKEEGFFFGISDSLYVAPWTEEMKGEIGIRLLGSKISEFSKKLYDLAMAFD
jgi:hypothetical protein